MLLQIDKAFTRFAYKLGVESAYIAAKGKKNALESSNDLPISMAVLVDKCNSFNQLPANRAIYFIALLEQLQKQNYSGFIISSENYNYFLSNSNSPYLSKDIQILNNWKSIDTETVTKAYIRTLMTVKYGENHHGREFRVVISES
ncbi:MAG: hypothetical protein ABI721_00325 [Candidatus Dojkabacteria bacterium]